MFKTIFYKLFKYLLLNCDTKCWSLFKAPLDVTKSIKKVLPHYPIHLSRPKLNCLLSMILVLLYLICLRCLHFLEILPNHFLTLNCKKRLMNLHLVNNRPRFAYLSISLQFQPRNFVFIILIIKYFHYIVVELLLPQQTPSLLLSRLMILLWPHPVITMVICFMEV